MGPTFLYSMTVAGAVALYMVVRRGKASLRVLGALLGLGAFGTVLIGLSGGLSIPDASTVFFYTFSVIAVASAVRLITHERPVYSALYFILVVLSSAGLLLLLQAEFMAFSLVIVYAGAILITYLFVLMLAQQAADPNDPDGQPEYDRNPREPAAAVIVGFILLAVLSSMLFQNVVSEVAQPSIASARRASWTDLQMLPRQLDDVVKSIEPDFEWANDQIRIFTEPDGSAYVVGTVGDIETRLTLPDEYSGTPDNPTVAPTNIQRVGLSLVADFPASLELAGVILLMAMFGAVVLARKQIELGEDELRAAVGMRRISHHDEYDVMDADDETGGAA